MINKSLDNPNYISVFLKENDPATLTKIFVKKSHIAKRLTVRFNSKENRFVLTVPKNCNTKVAHKFINSSKDWLIKQSTKSDEIIQIRDGAIISFKGKPLKIKYMNKLRGVTNLKNSHDENEPDILEVYGMEDFISKRVAEFLKNEARIRLNDKANEYSKALGVSFNKITIKDQATRWGSCSARGNLAFSFRLILAPLYVVDYVAAHEVAHLKELNHSRNFWKNVSLIFPDYKLAEYWLKKNSHKLHKYNFN